jgi:hypothetical protein
MGDGPGPVAAVPVTYPATPFPRLVLRVRASVTLCWKPLAFSGLIWYATAVCIDY